MNYYTRDIVIIIMVRIHIIHILQIITLRYLRTIRINLHIKLLERPLIQTYTIRSQQFKENTSSQGNRY